LDFRKTISERFPAASSQFRAMSEGFPPGHGGRRVARPHPRGRTAVSCSVATSASPNACTHRRFAERGRAPNLNGGCVMSDRLRILSIDGGGIRGIIPAMVIKALLGDLKAHDAFHISPGLRQAESSRVA
jgi:hypothetical protein